MDRLNSVKDDSSNRRQDYLLLEGMTPLQHFDFLISPAIPLAAI